MEDSLFKEFFTCPHCGDALISKEKLSKMSEEDLDNYCTRCGKEIASAYKKHWQEAKAF